MARHDAITGQKENRISGYMQDDPDIPRVMSEKTPIDSREDKHMGIEYNSLGEQLIDVAVAGKNGIISKRLQRAATGLNESVPSEGGFLLEQQYAKDLLENAWESAVVAPLCWQVFIGGNSNSLKIPGYD
jgi:hypothetical protein